MKTALSTLLFAAMTLPLCAQRYQPAALPVGDSSHPKDHLVQPMTIDTAVAEEPVASAPRQLAPFDIQLEVHRNEALKLQVAVGDRGMPFVGVMLASLSDQVIKIEGLPPLLFVDAIVASGVGIGTLTFNMGPSALPFPVFLQGVVLTDEWIGASKVHELPAK